MKVREILRVKGSALFSTEPLESLDKAVSKMADLDAGSLVVLEGGDMVGMLTFREALQAVSQQKGNIAGVLVKDVMVKNPDTVSPETEANDLRRMMIERHMRYLPVVDNGKLQGVISLLDVAKAVLEEQGFENQMLKNYIRDWPNETPTT